MTTTSPTIRTQSDSTKPISSESAGVVENDSIRIDTVKQFIAAFIKADMKKLETVTDIEKYDHSILPSVLHAPNHNWTTYCKFVMSTAGSPDFKNYDYVIHDIQETYNHTVIANVSTTVDTPVGVYATEYVMYYYLNPEGNKVVKVTEFVDSKSTSEFFIKLRTHQASHSAQGD